MYCSNCGQENLGSGRFCVHCGSMVTDRPTVPREPEIAVSQQIAQDEIKKRALTTFGIIAAVILIIVLIVAERTSYQRVVHDYFKAYEKADLDQLISTRADFEMDYYELRYGETEYRERCQNKMENQLERWEDCGNNPTIKYDIHRATQVSEMDLRDLEDDLSDRYDCKDLYIKDAYVLDVEFYVTGPGDQMLFEGTIVMVKESGKWSVLTGYVDTDFFEGYSASFERTK